MKMNSETYITGSPFSEGTCRVIIANYITTGIVKAAAFALDVWCLGVKEVFIYEFKGDESDLRALMMRKTASFKTVESHSGAFGRKLVEDCLSYAQHLGFSPPPDYEKACEVFHGIDVADCKETFLFGKNGKPCYVIDQDTTTAEIRRIIATLESRCGVGGFRVINHRGEDYRKSKAKEADDLLFYVSGSHEVLSTISPIVEKSGFDYLSNHQNFSRFIYTQSPNLADFILDFSTFLSAGYPPEIPLEPKVFAAVMMLSFLQISEDEQEAFLGHFPDKMQREFRNRYYKIYNDGLFDVMKKTGNLDFTILEWKLAPLTTSTGETEEKLVVIHARTELLKAINLPAPNYLQQTLDALKSSDSSSDFSF